MIATVYVVTDEPYHDNSSILGVYDSLEKAKASVADVKWDAEGYYVKYWGAASNSPEQPGGGHYLIHRFEVQS